MTWLYLSKVLSSAALGAVALCFSVPASAEGGEGGSIILPHEFESLQSAAAAEAESMAAEGEKAASESDPSDKPSKVVAKKGAVPAVSAQKEAGGETAKSGKLAAARDMETAREAGDVGQTAALGPVQTSGRSSRQTDVARADALKPLIAHYASENALPFELADAIVRLESRYNAGARNGPNLGLTQVNFRTAQSLGYKGDAAGLLDAETNLQYGLRYLAQAYRLAAGDTCGTILRYQFGHRAQAMTKASRVYCAKVKTITAAAE